MTTPQIAESPLALPIQPDAILTLIPALDEAASIGSVVEGLKSMGLKRVRVVDNGSSDDTVTWAKATGAETVVEPRRGYGRACWRGLQDLPEGVEWILFCDADGSDDLRELSAFFSSAANVDLVLGNRRATDEGRAAMTWLQNFGNGLATTLIRWGWGHRYHDLGPLRLVRREAVERMKMEDRGFGWTVEMQVRAVELGLRIVEIPVHYRRRQGGRSKISGTLCGAVRAGRAILGTLAKLDLRRLRA